MPTKEKQLNILLLEDAISFRVAIQSILNKRANVYAVEAPSTAFRILKSKKIDILISDYLLPEMDGLKVLEKVKNEFPEIEVIMISSSGDMETVIDALRNGATDFLKKPFEANDIWVAIERTKKFSDLQLSLKKYKNKHQQLKKEISKEFGHSIIGNSPAIKNIKNQMKMVAETPDTSVLLIGESGTGKELVARGIHNLSSRKDEVFGAVNMSAVPETLFESEFFGHKRGSFTGAISDKAGWFESTNEGTLFFDEVGEMSITLQVKLLRVLEDRKFTKIGTQQEQEFNVRIVAATNKSVNELTGGKNFRLDLFHRLGTFIIEIPPLRNRAEDIPILVDFFTNSLTQKMGKNITSINSEVYHLLKTYSFPGNIRELKNLVERAIIVCQTNELTPNNFNLSFVHSTSAQNSAPADEICDLKELERQTIIRVLDKVNFNKAEAARMLNLEWNALYRRIQKYEIDLPKSLC